MADKLSGQAQAAPPADARTMIARHAAASEPVWLWDPRRNRIVWANRAAVQFWEAGSALDLVEYRFLAGSPEAALANGLRGGVEREAVLAPNGKPLRVHLRSEDAVLLDGSEGILVCLLETGVMAAESPVSRKASLFDAAPVALVSVTVKGEIRQANPAALPYCAALSTEMVADIALQALARGSFNQTREVSIDRQDRILRVFASRLDDSVEPCVLLQIDDVTDRRALEALAPQTAQAPSTVAVPGAQPDATAQRRLVTNLSHEMRNPLNAILGFSEVMQQRRFGPVGNHRYEGYIDDIHLSAGHLLDLVNDLLDLGTLAEGHFKVDFESVNLATVVDECGRILKSLAVDAGVRLLLDLPPTLPPVVADKRAMRQILLNVMSNAIKFTRRDGQVRVSASLDSGGGVTLRVSDTGIGMTEDELAHAMQPYGRIDSALQRSHRGTGLGLPLAKALSDATKCTFQIESAPRQGTVVTITFAPTRVLAG